MHRIHRSVCVLAGLFAGAIAALAAALATSAPPPGPVLARSGLMTIRPGNGLSGGTAGWTSRVPAPVHAAVTSGMPGWQITLIAIGAALLAAAAALLVDRVWMARRHATAKAA
jgi:hypothetical protein